MTCYISAFYDLGRENWNSFSRSFETYKIRFLPFIDLFSKTDNDNMILFIDEKHYITMKKEIELANSKIKLIKINKEFLEQFYSWSKINRERQIMNSENFKKLIYHRRHCPECYIPEYTMINHTKIDFINYVINNKLTDKEIFVWVDFGFFSKTELVPKKLLDTSLFDTSKITYSLINPIEEFDNNKMYTLITAPEKIGGFFFIGNKYAIQQYQILYHKMIDDYHNNDLCDDDQALAIASYFQNKNLFSFTKKFGWHTILINHQLS